MGMGVGNVVRESMGMEVGDMGMGVGDMERGSMRMGWVVGDMGMGA